MRLAELKPRWIHLANWSESSPLYAIGLSFECPHCRRRRAVYFKPHIDPEGLFQRYQWTFTPESVSGGNPVWNRSGDTFDTLTLSPSVNFGGGHWHGHVENGALNPSGAPVQKEGE